MGITKKEFVKYLERYPDDAEFCILAANPPARKIYPVTGLSCIIDLEYPVLCVELGDSQNMNEEMIEAEGEATDG